jgi:hypothetical protein
MDQPGRAIPIRSSHRSRSSRRSRSRRPSRRLPSRRRGHYESDSYDSSSSNGDFDLPRRRSSRLRRSRSRVSSRHRSSARFQPRWPRRTAILWGQALIPYTEGSEDNDLGRRNGAASRRLPGLSHRSNWGFSWEGRTGDLFLTNVACEHGNWPPSCATCEVEPAGDRPFHLETHDRILLGLGDGPFQWRAGGVGTEAVRMLHKLLGRPRTGSSGARLDLAGRTDANDNSEPSQMFNVPGSSDSD